ncbi:hypothetical protein [Stappia indica]|uniref:hypothetical protein n=1 Tax=Stappia indica TaxID=538381 RepID=UPI001CD19C98|nr:hypothetical protein [Stappia indica]MCA1300764.1 hypothetical protein [Stappia indica]
MRIERGQRSIPGTHGRREAATVSARNATASGIVSSRAIVAIEPVEAIRPESFRRYRGANPAFIAQLIAHRENLPQTRARRRADPATAIGAYTAVERMPRHIPTGRLLSVCK